MAEGITPRDNSTLTEEDLLRNKPAVHILLKFSFVKKPTLFLSVNIPHELQAELRNVSTLQQSLSRLKVLTFSDGLDGAASLRDQQRGIVELQWSYLTINVLLDYEEANKTLQETGMLNDHLAVNPSRMGAFVYNDVDAQHLFQLSFPIFYICPYRAFDHQVILQIVDLQHPTKQGVQLAPANPL
ncbi:hypothetical protein GYMLUDRAFT_263800 [Collybiopsis luxurians FD-317 M1]|uniref:Uncharacterized protein n=1 Tax=Collybiopsis luxurians FD-317 M1 TaxID=944289 RepID=A0A0D0BMH6_9AGAR|nr:hypothetical protein GYMLUDRAFT_263800 [Collybiopsis luxurians FD-317 M1]